MVEVTVSAVEAGKKVHRLVRQLLPGVPLSGVHKMIRTGRVKRNGKKAKPDDVLEVGDVLRLYMAEADYQSVSKPEKKFRGVSTDVDVVYEDDEMLLVNKPVGVLTHGAQGEHKDTLVNMVLAYLHEKGELHQSLFTPSSVNRLDRNTSGLVLFGKTGAATRQLSEDIKNHLLQKWYLAIVRGKTEERGEITARLERDEDRNVTGVSVEGMDACTRYERLYTTGKTSVVRIELVSGRTHQIRAHFKHIGHSLYGDVKYGGGARTRHTEDKVFVESHQWLHAGWIRLADGRTFFAPPPREYAETLRTLGYTLEQIRSLNRFKPQ